jgi:hypothetical protein
MVIVNSLHVIGELFIGRRTIMEQYDGPVDYKYGIGPKVMNLT